MRKRIKFIKQTDPKDCGPVCMAMISNHYGYSVSVTRLREYGGTDLQGTNIAGLMKIAEKLGFNARGVRAEDPSALNEIPTPSIAHVITKDGFAHFVIIELLDYIFECNYRIIMAIWRYGDMAIWRYGDVMCLN